MRVETREEYAQYVTILLNDAIDSIRDNAYGDALDGLETAVAAIKEAREKFDKA